MITTLDQLRQFYAARPHASVLYFDSETTGKVLWRAPIADAYQPRVVQLACRLDDPADQLVGAATLLLKPTDWTIPPEAAAIHGWTTLDCATFGVPAKVALATWGWLADSAAILVAYNAAFDVRMLSIEADRLGRGDPFDPSRNLVVCDPMPICAPLCKLPKPPGHPTPAGDEYKWPTLAQAHEKLTGQPLAHAHDAGGDVDGLRRVYHALRALIQPPAADLQSPLSDLQPPLSALQSPISNLKSSP